MSEQENFYTFKGYQSNASAELTTAMEDYLEMIYRILQKKEVVRVGELSRLLHVKPSSATKMMQQLNELGYIFSEKYGYIRLTVKGSEAGEYLLYRHNVLHRFLCILNHSTDELEQVEKIEHFLNKTTVENLRTLTVRLDNESNL